MTSQWSLDRKWFWDGRRWHDAISPDANFRYNGAAGEPWTGGPAGAEPPPPAGALPHSAHDHPRADVFRIGADSVRLYLKHIVGLFVVALPAVGFLGFILVGADLGAGLAEHLTPFTSVPAGAQPPPAAAGADLLTRMGVVAGIFAVAAALVVPLGIGALCAAAASALEGEPYEMEECYRLAAGRYLHLLGATAAIVLSPIVVLAGLVGLALLTGFRFIFLGQLLNALALRIALAPVPIMVRRASLVSALRTSWHITGGARFFALALLVIVTAIAVALPPLLLAGLPAGAGPDLTITLRVGEALGVLAGAVTAPLAAVVLTVAYFRWQQPAA